MENGNRVKSKQCFRASFFAEPICLQYFISIVYLECKEFFVYLRHFMRSHLYDFLLFYQDGTVTFCIVTPLLDDTTLVKMYSVSRKQSFARLFFVLCLIGLITYILLAIYTFRSSIATSLKESRTQKKLKGYPVPEIVKPGHEDLRYILLWTVPEVAYKFDKEGQKVFDDNNCDYKNCYITVDKNFLHNDVRKFDAIIFSRNVLVKWKKNMPTQRSMLQKYIFYSMLPSDEFPVCDVHTDNFFNWTWTYKLYSDISTPFIEVKTLKGKRIAPSVEVDWNQDVLCLYNDTCRVKNIAMMWHREDCHNTKMTFFVRELQFHMKEHGLEFDVFGCVNKCPPEGCLKAIEANYSFYFVVEENMSDDYLTKEVLKAYNYNAIPVITSAADYSKFLPPGSYIDARSESPEGLAGLIKYILANPTIYSKYFDWKHYYTINEAPIQRGYCELCDLLNDKERMESKGYYERFRKWWYYGNMKEKCFPKGGESMDDVLSYVKNIELRQKLINLP